MRFECARCRQESEGRRLIIEQNATDDTGLATLVEKCWSKDPKRTYGAGGDQLPVVVRAVAGGICQPGPAAG